MAAPTAIPVKPGSEIGVSIILCVPNSSTNPDKTLNGVPASATSSPRTITRSSNRISSAIASLTAAPKVISLIPYILNLDLMCFNLKQRHAYQLQMSQAMQHQERN